MLGSLRFSALVGLLLSTGLLLRSPACYAQAPGPATMPAAHGYDFLTVTVNEGTKAFSFLLFSPAFQGKTEVQLETNMAVGAEKFKERINQNAQLVNEQLSALTVAGWELVQMYTPVTPTNRHCYLFRKAKN